jgi:hypothetical protein
MKFLWTLFVFTSSAFAIIDGSPVDPASQIAKNTVYLDLGKTKCSGIYLEQGVILTAAHCFEHTPAKTPIQIKFGVSVANPVAVITTSDFVVSKDFDLALIFFTATVPTSAQTAEVLPVADMIKSGALMRVAGYGDVQPSEKMTEPSPSLQSKLLRIDAIANDDVEFSQSLGGTCVGDSGGPAYVEFNQHEYLWGVSSYLEAPDDVEMCHGDSHYVNILSHLKWIADQHALFLKAK